VDGCVGRGIHPTDGPLRRRRPPGGSSPTPVAVATSGRGQSRLERDDHQQGPIPGPSLCRKRYSPLSTTARSASQCPTTLRCAADSGSPRSGWRRGGRNGGHVGYVGCGVTSTTGGAARSVAWRAMTPAVQAGRMTRRFHRSRRLRRPIVRSRRPSGERHQPDQAATTDPSQSQAMTPHERKRGIRP
jgi:hypothetical protein